MGTVFIFRDAMPFGDVPLIGRYLSVGDLIYAALLALVLTFVITKLWSGVKMWFNPIAPENRADFNKIIQKCYALFPYDILQFHGQTFKRGMIIKVTTLSRKTFEGQLIGFNKDNIICVLTKNHIAADTLDNIQEIVLVEE